MYIPKKDREIIKMKFGGLCAYTGTPLEDDWQVDHINPKRLYDAGRINGDPNHIDNLIPCQRIVNHYKRAEPLDSFRTWLLGGLHERLKKLPKNPKAEKTVKHKAYLLEVAGLFDITPDKPFSGKFYFEKIEK